VLENPVAPAVQVALAALENPVVPVALAMLENLVVRAVQVALAVLENPGVPAALARQVVAALLRQVEAVASQVGAAEREAQTRSAAISRRGAAVVVVVAPLLAGVGALLKPRAAEVAVA
jgi:hypothetical protein